VFEKWSGRRDSNPRRPAWEAGILPLNYSRLPSSIYLFSKDAVVKRRPSLGRRLRCSRLLSIPRQIQHITPDVHTGRRGSPLGHFSARLGATCSLAIDAVIAPRPRRAGGDLSQDSMKTGRLSDGRELETPTPDCARRRSNASSRLARFLEISGQSTAEQSRRALLEAPGLRVSYRLKRSRGAGAVAGKSGDSVRACAVPAAESGPQACSRYKRRIAPFPISRKPPAAIRMQAHLADLDYLLTQAYQRSGLAQGIFLKRQDLIKAGAGSSRRARPNNRSARSSVLPAHERLEPGWPSSIQPLHRSTRPMALDFSRHPPSTPARIERPDGSRTKSKKLVVMWLYWLSTPMAAQSRRSCSSRLVTGDSATTHDRSHSPTARWFIESGDHRVHLAVTI
jgi:hypothetical protein